mmetsp:Transcript_22451/g.27514  ORF Transcript_22451/g.27514 Transcript_22451/m.27514 type:complete len:315 (-) Transcript_22451:23-967(-)
MNSHVNSLPDPRQTWAHSTCSENDLMQALEDSRISAIEADILMGTDNNDQSLQLQPIMSHPPDTSSDLNFRNFLRLSTSHNVERKEYCIKKHLKLDFKEIGAVKPVLEMLDDVLLRKQNNNKLKTIFLNADILNGPGVRYESLPVACEDFIKTCLQFMKQDTNWQAQCAFSIGWKVDCRSFSGYTDEDIHSMKSVLKKYDLIRSCQGVVLAVNARLVAMNPQPFVSIMKEIPELQILIWTGTGEPQISKRKIMSIKTYFESEGFIDRIGFDCKIAPSFLSGVFYDTAVDTVGIFWKIKKIILRNVNSLRNSLKN